jgi:ATP-dependent Clp protease ATP-binding subunit ClpC
MIMVMPFTLPAVPSSDGENPSPNENPLVTFVADLGRFGTDLTALARDNALTVAYGRDDEVENLLRALAAPGNLFPAVVGSSRSGKTTIVHHAVNRIVRGECPAALLGKPVFELTPSRLINALGGGEQWRNAIGTFFSALTESGAVLFLRDCHTMLGLGMHNGDGPDLSAVLNDLMQAMHPLVLFEGNTRGMESLFTVRPAIKSLFALIQIQGLTVETAAPLIKRAAEDLEVVHAVHIKQDAIDQVIELAARFQVNDLLPGTALDLLKDTLATSVQSGGDLDAATVLTRFKQRSGLPDFLVSDDVPYDEAGTRALLTQRVYGQNAAVEAILRMIALVRARLNNPLRPMGVFLFLGPTGVGKTELVKALAKFLYGESERILRFNMADYPYDWSALVLFGNPNAVTETDRQGQLSVRLAPQTFSVLLLDEFEKANYSIYQRFLQLFDEGILVNSQGEEINLRNTIIVLTSNLGAAVLNSRKIGFSRPEMPNEAEQVVMRESESYFRPEFINRLDAVSFFKPLSRPVIRQIAKREIADVIARDGIRRLNLSITVDDAVIDLMVERGYDPSFGARYLKRQIERSITYPLARQIARKRIGPGSVVRLIVHEGEIAVNLVEATDTDDGLAPAPRETGGLSARELRTRLDEMNTRIAHLVKQHDIETLRERMNQMMERIAEPDFWQDAREAARQIESMNALTQRVDQTDNLRRLAESCDRALKDAGSARGRSRAASAALHDANRAFAELSRELPLTELLLCLRSDADRAGAFVNIRAIGNTGKAWVGDLARMYAGWAESRGFTSAVLNETPGDGGGVDQITLSVSGYGVYALLKGESGAHRLVFPAEKRPAEKITAWAQIDVHPDLPLTQQQLSDVLKTMRIENTGVRETGVIEERITRRLVITQQHALGVQTLYWRNRLSTDDIEDQVARYLHALGNRVNTPSATLSDDVLVASQVRTYTLYKANSVRDTRTGHSSTQTRRVLAGELDAFLLAFLEMSVGE